MLLTKKNTLRKNGKQGPADLDAFMTVVFLDADKAIFVLLAFKLRLVVVKLSGWDCCYLLMRYSYKTDY